MQRGKEEETKGRDRRGEKEVRDILDMDRKRQRGTDREEETERRDRGEQTEGKKQRGKT
jgi:hypothetical protein